MTEYTVSVACNFEAATPKDAMHQMIAWLDETAWAAGYRITADDGTNEFLDASA